ncbi:TetR family transcriptional regulator [Micromonospora terminaliae]|uniref:TetR family transcriptional regulator n=1 Tax=Micromonospora terminaliae TaxID=1914461 RepID=A0AAJ2ZHG3_9ACTN|nr:TetR/AcrR family transcriptional regulator C-terminal domain-containing protein [Micromonospora terminaliae]NES29968.1 TetR/AcrR family transcriptional regulator [Micromonospora terminaliae]QGL46856.1 TetR family transcriptional regulator [Micromonospora terminaliae]
MPEQAETLRRTPLSRDRVLRAAVALADEAGIESLSMRNLAQDLGVVPMALYKHVANKDELLAGMIDVVVGEIDPPVSGDWKHAVRRRILSAREMLLRHPWAPLAIESRNTATPAILGYLDSMIGTFRAGGFSVDLAHHVMHAMGSRILGFSQELFDASRRAGRSGTPDPEPPAADLPPEVAAAFPHVAEIALAASHDDESVVGPGCDDQFEFEFALDLLLDGIERLHRQGWTSSRRAR